MLTALAALACGRISGGGGGAGAVAVLPDLPPIEAGAGATTPSLLSVLPTADALHVAWDLQGEGDRLALFLGADVGTLFEAGPVLTPLDGSGVVLPGLATATTWFVGLALVDGPEPLPLGPVLRARTAPPIHVDVAAGPGGDGQSPASPYDDIITALIDSLILGGANLWLAGGDYPGSALPLFAGTHVYGGFAPDFDPATRNPSERPSVLRGVAGAPIIDADPGPSTALLDGLALDGAGLAPVGLQAFDVPVEMRGVTVLSCTGPGLRLRGDPGAAPETMLLLDVLSVGHGAEGMAVQGTLDLQLFRCRFESNVQEGMDVDDLQVAAGGSVAVRVDGCRFAGNGTDGLDLDMAPTPFEAAGRFRVVIDRCRFERNGQTGLLLDVDFDQASGGSAELLLRGNLHRANRGTGLVLDLDGPASATVDLARVAANGAQGVLLSSDVVAAQAVLTRSAILANLGPGLATADGIATLIGAQLVLTGNGQGLDDSGGTTALASALSWAQPGGLGDARALACVALTDEAPAPLERLPLATSSVAAWSEASPAELLLSSDPASLVPAPASVEVHDDGTARGLLAFLPGGGLLLEPAPLSAEPPCAVQLFDAGDAQEDWRAPPGSPASGAGLAAPGEVAPDVGALVDPGGPFPGGLAADASPPLELRRVEPPLHLPLSAGATLQLEFGRPLDPSHVGPHSVQVLDGNRVDVGALAVVVDGDLQISPPVGGWPTGALFVVLHPALSDVDGASPSASLALPLDVSP